MHPNMAANPNTVDHTQFAQGIHARIGGGSGQATSLLRNQMLAMRAVCIYICEIEIYFNKLRAVEKALNKQLKDLEKDQEAPEE